MVLKDKKKKKKPRPRRLGSKAFVPVFKTGMNRDIPLGGAGGSQNLIANLLASRQAQPSAQVIQTPDQFKLQQDIRSIKVEQAAQAEEQKVEKKRNANYGLTFAENRLRLDLLAAEKEAATRQKQEDMRAENEAKSQKRGGGRQPGKKQHTSFPDAGGILNESADGIVGGKDSGTTAAGGAEKLAQIPTFDLRTKEGKAAYEDYKQRNPME
jgi:hypothetical protein